MIPLCIVVIGMICNKKPTDTNRIYYNLISQGESTFTFLNCLILFDAWR